MEEEIIDDLKSIIKYINENGSMYCDNEDSTAIQGLLDLYNKEKEKNKELEGMIKNRIKYTNELEKDLFENASNYVIPKSKLREKIEELENKMPPDDDYAFEIQNDIYSKINILQELLEGDDK